MKDAKTNYLLNWIALRIHILETATIHVSTLILSNMHIWRAEVLTSLIYLTEYI